MPVPVAVGDVVDVDQVEGDAMVGIMVVNESLGPNPEQAEPVNRILWASWA